MADSAREILNTTTKGIKKKTASHKVGTEITDNRPHLTFAKMLKRIVKRLMVSIIEAGSVSAFIFIPLAPRCNNPPKIDKLHHPR